eukprot:TRINITY_DN16914_c0_g1_i1.p2 TRINITY_DN16914_c0_g1~~TRINITY_DN16914_c0_g1_i1.p2  ORF type:complete len:174 (-),score=46.59 TRINITY_DN16914_c0_g1_i1:100-621(-)
MFFYTRIDRDLYLHPRHFGREIKQQIVQKLHEEVEGTCHGRYGFIIAVTEIDTENMGMGMVQEGTGFVVYPVTFSAVVMKPFPNEIIDAVVTSTTVNGLLCSAGPLDIFCSHWNIPEEYEFNRQNNTYTSSDGLVIANDSDVRIKVLTVRYQAHKIACVATLKGNYLGPIQYM